MIWPLIPQLPNLQPPSVCSQCPLTRAFTVPQTQCLMPWALYICHSCAPCSSSWDLHGLASRAIQTHLHRGTLPWPLYGIFLPLLRLPVPSSLRLWYGPKSFGNLGALTWTSSAWGLRSQQKFWVFLFNIYITTILLMSKKKWLTDRNLKEYSEGSILSCFQAT